MFTITNRISALGLLCVRVQASASVSQSCGERTYLSVRDGLARAP